MAQDNYEFQPIKTGGIIWCTLEAVDIESEPLRTEKFSSRAEKL
jgi:hypothetical protein